MMQGQHEWCDVEFCQEHISTHKWARIKAHGAGWYFTKDGRAFCPLHRPPWAPQVSQESA